VKVAVVIPARFSSSRLPGKPLLRDTGKYLIQHVYERASESRADVVVVATDDLRIADAVRSFGGEVAMTRDDHVSGTDRVAEVARKLKHEIIINAQGDEPLLDPRSIDTIADLLRGDPSASMATVGVPITSPAAFADPNCVKLVQDSRGRALYFSRSPIPYPRDGAPDFRKYPGVFLQHLGIYGYRRNFLLDLATWPPAPIEEIEKLEQLRVLAMGYSIKVGVVAHASRGVDTPADYERFVMEYRRLHPRAA
jgi:3-deoxy-manno-octulosonate cytidylyltransferase (CMP-KDO synthetase)